MLSDSCFHENLAIHLSNSLLKIIFKHCHSNFNAIYCSGFFNNVCKNVEASLLHILIQLKGDTHLTSTLRGLGWVR